jgi:hypothetical protein
VSRLLRHGGLLALATVGAVVLAGCGVQLPRGVQEPGSVAAEQREGGPIQVLPPGPRRDATAAEVVRGFLRAQSNPEHRHALAREFLAPPLRETWNDRAFVVVIDPGRRTIVQDPEEPSRVVVTEVAAARVGEDGAFRLESRTTPRPETYEVARQPTGELLLTGVPQGLRLSPEEVGRAVTPYDVYFLGSSGQGRLVPDRVFLPANEDPAEAVVASLLSGPSSALRGAVRSAAPAGLALERPVTTDDGVVTVDVGPEARGLSPDEQVRLSAQLAWTLRSAVGGAYTGLRLLVEGVPLDVPGVGPVQRRGAWADYDPDGLPPRAPAYYVADRALRSLDGGLAASEATQGGSLAVDGAAASPAGRLALLSRTDAGWELRTGPPQGPFGDPVLSAPQLGSLSWGSGERGLWLLAPGPAPQVLLVPADSAAAAAPVPYETPDDAGPLTALRVSRDGARIALVLGVEQARQLYVGRIEVVGAWPRITGVRAVVPELYDVTDVAWETGTSLVVLARQGGSGVAPFRVAVDGSTDEPVQRVGLPGAPESLAAAAGRPLVVSVVDEADRRVLYRDSGALFREVGPGSAPFYPG